MGLQFKIWETCGEASVSEILPAWSLSARHRAPGSESISSLIAQAVENLARSERRRRSAIRRFCLHNGCGFMFTLTFRDEPSTVAGVWREFKLFRERLRYRLGENVPMVGVVERGAKTGRLHLHVCVSRWYLDLGAVCICERCAPAAWVWRQAPPAPGALCVRCLWGLGMVSPPVEEVRSALGAALYVSKYVSKALRGELVVDEGEVVDEIAPIVTAGRQAYRVTEGFQPVPLLGEASSLDRALEIVGDVLGELEEVRAVHELVGEDWHGPETWTVVAAGRKLIGSAGRPREDHRSH